MPQGKDFFFYGRRGASAVHERCKRMQSIQIRYICDGEQCVANKRDDRVRAVCEQDGAIASCTVYAERTVELISVTLASQTAYEQDDTVFVNGYQSWTYSPERAIDSVQRGLLGLSNTPLGRKYASASGDYAFAPYGRKGCFHGYTYGYRRRADRLLLVGSLCDREGFTRVEFDTSAAQIRLVRDLQGKTLRAGESTLGARFGVYEGGYDETFDAYFKDLGVSPRTDEQLNGYTSWYNYFGNIDETILRRDLDGLSGMADAANIFQIDDGWQSKVGDWMVLRAPQFRDMKALADDVHARGYRAGLWLAPTLCAKDSRIAKEHADWLVRDPRNGKPVLGAIAWGGAYVLDICNEQARAYLRRVFDTVLNEWGYDLVKLDFLYSSCMIPRDGKTRGELMAMTVDFLRACCGDRRILGCGVPLGSCWGVFDYCRVGCDVDLKYRDVWYKRHTNQEMVSTPHAIADSVFRRHLHGRAFVNDPDVMFLRQDNLRYTELQKCVLASINAWTGGVHFVSDDIGAYSEQARALLQTVWGGQVGRLTDARLRGGVLQIEYSDDNGHNVLCLDLKTGEICNPV